MTSTTITHCCGDPARADRPTQAALRALASQLDDHLRKDVGLDRFAPLHGRASDRLPFDTLQAFL